MFVVKGLKLDVHACLFRFILNVNYGCHRDSEVEYSSAGFQFVTLL